MSNNNHNVTSDLIAYAAGSISCIASLPQMIKIIRKGSTEDLSLSTMILVILSLSFWEVWGIMVKAAPVIVTNGIALGISSINLGLKIRNEYWKKKEATEGVNTTEIVALIR